MYTRYRSHPGYPPPPYEALAGASALQSAMPGRVTSVARRVNPLSTLEMGFPLPSSARACRGSARRRHLASMRLYNSARLRSRRGAWVAEPVVAGHVATRHHDFPHNRAGLSTSYVAASPLSPRRQTLGASLLLASDPQCATLGGRYGRTDAPAALDHPAGAGLRARDRRRGGRTRSAGAVRDRRQRQGHRPRHLGRSSATR